MTRIRDEADVRSAIVKDRVIEFGVAINHAGNGFIPERTYLRYTIQSLDSNGVVLSVNSQAIPWTEVPTAAKQLLVNAYRKVMQDAEDKGLVGAGTDVGELR